MKGCLRRRVVRRAWERDRHEARGDRDEESGALFLRRESACSLGLQVCAATYPDLDEVRKEGCHHAHDGEVVDVELGADLCEG